MGHVNKTIPVSNPDQVKNDTGSQPGSDTQIDTDSQSGSKKIRSNAHEAHEAEEAHEAHETQVARPRKIRVEIGHRRRPRKDSKKERTIPKKWTMSKKRIVPKKRPIPKRPVPKKEPVPTKVLAVLDGSVNSVSLLQRQSNQRARSKSNQGRARVTYTKNGTRMSC